MKNLTTGPDQSGQMLNFTVGRGSRNRNHNQRANFKKAAVQCLMLANKLIAEQKYKQAKELLIEASNYCHEVDEPDEYTKKLIELCYEETTIINKESTKKRHKERRLDTYDRIIIEKSHKVLILPFGRQQGQFALQSHQKMLFDLQDNPQRMRFNQQVQFHVSKLNAIVYDYNNTEQDSSLAHMSAIYKTQMIFAAILCVLLLIALFMSTQILGNLHSSVDNETLELLTVLVPSCAFICPLLMIFLRQVKDKNPKLYQLRLEEQLSKINSSTNSTCSYSLDNSNNLCIILRSQDPPKAHQFIFS